MTFLSPWFLLGAAAAALPIVLHLLKREPEPRVKFPAIRFLKHAPVEYTQKRRLRELLLLALRVTTLILLAVAFARPFFATAGTAGTAGATIIALDTSYSMSGPRVFERARRLAHAAVDRAAAGEPVGILTFADAAALVVPPTLDRAVARAAIDRSAPGFGATRYRGALAAAVQALAGRRGTVILVTDLQATGWDVGDRAAVPESTRIQVLDVEAGRSNLGVTAVRTSAAKVIATVRNSGDDSRDVRARLDLDGRRSGEVRVPVGPHASADVELGDAGQAAVAVVTVDDPGGFAADDVRYAVLEAAGRPPALIVTSAGDAAREGFYVQKAISAGHVLDPIVVRAGQLSALEAGLAADAAVILLSTHGLEPRGRESLARYLRSGGGVLIAAGPDLDGEIIADLLGDRVTKLIHGPGEQAVGQSLMLDDATHPVFRSFEREDAALRLATFRQVAHVEATGCQRIARFSNGETALLECPVGEGRALVIASDLDNRWNDFPLRAAFVPFLHDTLRYLARGRPARSEYFVGGVPAGVAPRPGVVTIPSTGPVRRIAVNVDPRESDLAGLSQAEFQRAVTRLKDAGSAAGKTEARQQEDRQHLWMYFVATALAALVVEGMVSSRTA